jgi:ribosome maturation factor RimP
MVLIDVSVSQHKESVEVRAIIYKNGSVGTDDCTHVHRAMAPHLELLFPGRELYLEVSSPGITRTIKDASEFAYYVGRGIKCYRLDIADWTGGILESVDKTALVLKGKEGMVKLNYEVIAKAKLDYTEEE